MSLVAAKKDDETDHNYIHTTKDIDTEFVEGTLCEERQHNMIHLYESAKNHTNINEFIETEVSECMSKMKMDALIQPSLGSRSLKGYQCQIYSRPMAMEQMTSSTSRTVA